IGPSSSGGWQNSRLPLGSQFDQQAIRVRVRFESDAYAVGGANGNPAGWYLDTFLLTELLDLGLVLADLQIDDTVEGDGDGYPEAGETITIQPVLANFSDAAYTSLTGTVKIVAAGIDDTADFFPDGVSSVLDFGDINRLDLGTATAPLRIHLPASLHPESKIMLILQLGDAEGKHAEILHDLSIEPRASIRGHVEDAGGVPLAGILVEARRGSFSTQAYSDATGHYALQGLRYRTTYTLTAGNRERLVTVPAGDLDGVDWVLFGDASVDSESAFPSAVADEGDSVVAQPSATEPPSPDPVELLPPPAIAGTEAVSGIVSVVRWNLDMSDSVTEPVSNATVIVEGVQGGEIARTQTDEFGAYAFSDLAEGPHWFRVVAPPAPKPPEPPEDDDDDDGDEEDDEIVEPPPPHPWYVTPSGRTVVVGVDASEQPFVFQDYGFKVPFLKVQSASFVDANGDGFLDRGELATVMVSLENEGATVSLNTTGQLATAWMGIDDIMAVTAADASSQIDIYNDGPIRTLTPSFQIQVDENAPKNALQRFSVVVEGTNPVAGTKLTWPFDFSFRADDRVTIHVSVTFSDAPDAALRAARLADTRVRLTLGDALGDASMTRRPDADGNIVFTGGMVQLGASGTIEVVRLPEGVAAPPVVDIAPLTDDLAVHFVLEPLAIAVTPPDGLHFRIQEGLSDAATLVIRNDSLETMDLDFGVRYRRQADEVRVPAASVASAAWDAAEVVGAAELAEADTAFEKTGEVVVRFAEGVLRAEQEALLASAGLEPVFFFNSFPAALARPISVPDGMVAVATASPAAMEEDNRVLLVAPDYVAESYALPEPNDPDYWRMYGLHNRRQTGGTLGMDIRAREAWAHTIGSRDVVVGVADTGILTSHQDITANLWENPSPGTTEGITGDIHGWNFYDWDNNVEDDDIFTSGHGTHVSGTIGAVGNNGEGVVGVNWDVQLMALRLTGPFSTFTSSARIAKAIEYAAENGAQVSNHSWGGPETAGVMRDAILYAATQNHLVVAAAGNSALDLEHKRAYPAGYGGVLDNVITVAASDHHGELATFSNFGKNRVQLAAPGVDILSTWSSGGFPEYLSISGTSMAAPHVTGVAALLWSLDPDAPYTVIRDAILRGVRKDSRLEGWVSTSGHLDAWGAMQALGAQWLALDQTQTTLAPGEAIELSVTVNDPAVLQARDMDYRADILIQLAGSLESSIVPVSVAVGPRAWLEYEDVRIENAADWPDGLAASPGDTLSLWVTLRNRGSGAAMQVHGALRSHGDVSMQTGTATWGTFYGEMTDESEAPFVVTLGEGVDADVTLILDLFQGETLVGTIPIEIPVLLGQHASGRVLADGAGVTALIEAFGARGARTATKPDGTFVLRGLADGEYHLRVIPAAHSRHEQTFSISGADVSLGDIVVGAPVGHPNVAQVAVDGVLGGQVEQVLAILNDAGDAPFAFVARAVPQRRVALISDGTSLDVLVAPLEAMGFDVSHYTENFVRRQVFSPFIGSYQLQQQVRWSNHAAVLAGYDAVIADLSGPDGNGRLFSNLEQSAFRTYTERGGYAFITGSNPLSFPDNHVLVRLLGIDSPDRAEEGSDGQILASRIFESPFISLSDSGQYVLGASQHYDVAAVNPSLSRVLFEAELANKVVMRRHGAGQLHMWSGNRDAGDWQAPGIWLDVLRGLLWNGLYENSEAEVAWLGLHPSVGVGAVGVAATSAQEVHGTVPAGGIGEIGISMSAVYPARPETEQAVIVILGEAAGVDVRAVPVNFAISTPVLRVYTSGTVTDWRGHPLKGDGSAASARYQVLLANAVDAVLPPTPDGQPAPGQHLLGTVLDGRLYGHFGTGQGVPADAGRFSQTFRLPADLPDGYVFVRAWDSPSFETSIAYGDSPLFPVEYVAHAARDFGSWGV
ncbi:MAG: S8 family serine peptidase, partial [Kiritimatiellia bacterium]